MLLQNYVSDLKEEGLASSTIKKIYNIIKGSLDYAVNMELLPSNPAKKIQLPKDKKKEMTVWDIYKLKLCFTSSRTPAAFYQNDLL